MIVKVVLFASAKDIVGQEAVELNLDDDATIADAKASLGQLYPDLVELISCSTWSMDHEYVDDSQALHSAAEIGLIPPVSGG